MYSVMDHGSRWLWTYLHDWRAGVESDEDGVTILCATVNQHRLVGYSGRVRLRCVEVQGTVNHE